MTLTQILIISFKTLMETTQFKLCNNQEFFPQVEVTCDWRPLLVESCFYTLESLISCVIDLIVYSVHTYLPTSRIGITKYEIILYCLVAVQWWSVITNHLPARTLSIMWNTKINPSDREQMSSQWRQFEPEFPARRVLSTRGFWTKSEVRVKSILSILVRIPELEGSSISSTIWWRGIRSWGSFSFTTTTAAETAAAPPTARKRFWIFEASFSK